MYLPATASVEESIARLNELHEAPAPVLTDAAGAANFTNEGGVDSTVRFLHNVMGLWVLSETLRVRRSRGSSADLGTLLAAAAELPAPQHLVDLTTTGFCRPATWPPASANGWPSGACRPPRPTRRSCG